MIRCKFHSQCTISMNYIAGSGNTAKNNETVRSQVRSAINQVTNNQTIRLVRDNSIFYSNL